MNLRTGRDLTLAYDHSDVSLLADFFEMEFGIMKVKKTNVVLYRYQVLLEIVAHNTQK